MSVCAKAILQPDGSYLLALDPANTNLTTCAYVVDTGVDSLLGSLMELTPEQALVLSAAAAGLWATAWAFKQVARSIGNGNENESEN